MRFNEGAMKQLGKLDKCDKEGRLDYKAPKDSYKERWFRLKGNLLFYYKTNSVGYMSDSEAVGVLVLERYSVQMEPMIADRSFVFSIAFDGESDRKYYFGGQSIKTCEDWIKALRGASFEQLKSKLMVLQAKIQDRTGRDPLDELYREKLKKKTGKSQRHSYDNPAIVPRTNHIQRPAAKVQSAPRELLLDPFNLAGWQNASGMSGGSLQGWETFE